ncbi:MAG TPA: hypothetical protein VFN67_14825 [Polyangiales bacterium]|nr:hypothetical protein [Polyangiales bacterium]
MTGEACGQQQLADPKAVFFLEGGECPSSRSDCVIPHGRALLVPMTSYIADGQMLATNQKRVSMPEAAYAQMIALSVRDLRLEIDGYPVKDLTPWIAQPVPFTTTIPPAPNYFSCAGSVDFEGDLHGYVVGVRIATCPDSWPTHASLWRNVLRRWL